MDAATFRAARVALGVTAETMARAFGASGGRTIYGWEQARSAVPGPVSVLVRLALADPDVANQLFQEIDP